MHGISEFWLFVFAHFWWVLGAVALVTLVAAWFVVRGLRRLGRALRHEVLLVLIAMPLLAAGSCTKRDIVVDTRPPAVITKRIFVPIDRKLTAPTAIAEGPLDQVIDVARERKQQLQSCNADKAAIAGVQGTPVPC